MMKQTENSYFVHGMLPTHNIQIISGGNNRKQNGSFSIKDNMLTPTLKELVFANNYTYK